MKTTVPKFTNRLANEKSPYLLQHKHNPVDWYAWGEEAFEKARREDKPIFLSIGYSTCHWCHVMERESFENEEIAEVLNKYFVSIKVDREERPDLDRVYMSYVQAITGNGGWPMSVWLTPDLKPFFGGTYFPPTDRWGRPGFKTLLLKIAESWEKDRENILTVSERATR
ncbi:MAG: thioredoxin domain-containing protein [Chloroherpetonaceae bacterium]|nr:thioredoxin domain-containing protein [Chloroherpetonaceae bacterium]